MKKNLELVRWAMAGPVATQNQALAVDVWRTLAARYAKASSVGGYDLINEPNLPSDVPKEALPRLYSSMSAAIRQVDHDHVVTLEGNTFAHDFAALQSPQDANEMYEFHEYSLFNPTWQSILRFYGRSSLITCRRQAQPPTDAGGGAAGRVSHACGDSDVQLPGGFRAGGNFGEQTGGASPVREIICLICL